MYSPNGIQTILFDLDGTLRYNRPASFDVFLDYAAHLGANNTPEVRRHVTRWTHYYWAQSPELAQDVKTYRELNDDFWVHYATRCLVQSGESLACAKEMAPEINRYMLEEHHPEDWIPPEVPETLERLKEAGFHLGVLSNRDESCTAYLEQVDLLKYFELNLVAGEVNAWKPDPQIFHHALQRLGQIPQQTIYVGDNYFADILGANKAGIQPVLIDPDNLFPEADCPVIQSLRELPGILEHG